MAVGFSAALVCVTLSQFMAAQTKTFHEKPVWTEILPDQTIVQRWENPKTRTTTTIYANRVGLICILDATKPEKTNETPKPRSKEAGEGAS